MSENNFNQQNNSTMQNNEQVKQQQPQNQSSENSYSGIRYTYTPNNAGYSQGSNYNTNMGSDNKKSRFKGNGCFISIIAVLLCITIVSAGICVVSLVGAAGNNIFKENYVENFSTPEPTSENTLQENSSDDENPSYVFDSVVEVKPTPTPNIVEGQILTPQQAAQKIIPSVVCIQCYTTSNYFGNSDTSSLYSEGSGIISRSDGYIITNAHVIEGASTVQVVLYNGTTCDAEIIGSDTVTDLALLKIDPKGLDLKVASFSSAKNLSVADSVLAVGNPGGIDFSSSVTSGIVSAVDRAIQDDTTGYVMHCIQTDTAINPGNSGGPLIDLYGNVVGITSSKIVAEGYENMGFAITYDEAAPILNDLLNYGHVKNRATINLTLALPSAVFRISGWNTLPRGLCITAVTGENESNAGLKQYDIIAAIDNTPIVSMAEYSSYLLTKKPGDKVQLKVYRASISGWSVQYSSTPIDIELTLSEAN